MNYVAISTTNETQSERFKQTLEDTPETFVLGIVLVNMYEAFHFFRQRICFLKRLSDSLKKPFHLQQSFATTVCLEKHSKHCHLGCVPYNSYCGKSWTNIVLLYLMTVYQSRWQQKMTKSKTEMLHILFGRLIIVNYPGGLIYSPSFSFGRS